MASLTPGSLLSGGKYVVVKELNRGGSAVVMEAVQTLTGRRVALKASTCCGVGLRVAAPRQGWRGVSLLQ